MGQKTQTLIILPNGDIAKRIDDFLYQPIGNVIIIEDYEWQIKVTCRVYAFGRDY